MDWRSGGSRIAALSAAALAAGSALAAAGALAGRGPHAVFTVTRKELGAVKAGASVSLAFPVRNDGDRPLRLLSVDGDCGCITAEYPRTVPAGRSAEIRARFEPLAPWDGPVEKGLVVRSDDPAQPEIKLAIVANVVPFIAMQPGSPLVLQYARGKTYQREIRLTPRPDSPLGLSNARSTSPLVKAVLVPPAAGDRARTYRLRLTIGPCDQPGDFNATVKMDTTEQRLGERWYAVVGLALSGPVASPREVFLASVRPTGPGQELARVQVFSRTGSLRLKGVETGSRLLRATVETHSPSHAYEVRLSATGRLKSGPLQTTLRIRTDDPSVPVLSVPFSATVQ
jgi:hypothetical protein